MVNYNYNYHNYLNEDGTFNRLKLAEDAFKLAKRANQRLLRLEQADLTNAPAYAGAVKALSGDYSESMSVDYGHISNGRPRYTESKTKIQKMGVKELNKMLYALEKTLSAKTSTKQGIKQLYSAGLNNLNKMLQECGYNNITMNDLLYIFRNKALKEAAKLYGYKAVIQMLGEKKTDRLEAFERNDAMEAYKKYTVSNFGKEMKDILANYLKEKEKYKKSLEKWKANGKQGTKPVPPRVPENILEIRKDLGLETKEFPTEWTLL